MTFLRLIDEVSRQPVSARCKPWAATPLEAAAEFSDLVTIARQGVVDSSRAYDHLAARFESYQPLDRRGH